MLEDVHGIRFVLYPYERSNVLGLVRHPADVAEFNVIPRLVRPGDVALDVGANVGFYSVLLSRLCGPSGRVWAFEPVPDTYWRLRETLALNRCENVVPVRAAVSDKDGIATMNLFAAEHSEWSSLAKPEMDGPGGTKIVPRSSVEVTSLSLRRFCAESGIDRINFLKVDVEGFEVDVFRGARRLLEGGRVDYVCFEISKASLSASRTESRRVFQTLAAYGYQSYRLDDMTLRFQGPVEDTDEEWANFFASRARMTEL
ncbi:MAG TPA: FkbM family methyltransferase [Terriglobia bacterium]|nr:FkbM family methyltransferase [Terriglobia bacterium]